MRRKVYHSTGNDFRVEGISKTLFEFSTPNFFTQNLTGNRNRGKLVLTRFNTSLWQKFGSSSQDEFAMSKLLIGKIIDGFLTFVIFKMLVIGVVVMPCKPITDNWGSAQWACIFLCRLFPVSQRVGAIWQEQGLQMQSIMPFQPHTRSSSISAYYHKRQVVEYGAILQLFSPYRSPIGRRTIG